MVLMTKDRSRVFCRAFLTNTVSDHAQKSEWLILIHSEKKGVTWNLFINQYCWMR